MPYLIGTKVEVDSYELLCRKAVKLPWPGEHGGGGRHADMPTKLPLPGEDAPGWTTRWQEPREHPTTKGLWAAKVLVGASTDKLDAAEQQALADAEAAGVELGEDWKAVAVEL